MIAVMLPMPAMVAGLMGNAHCLAMCGGISAAFAGRFNPLFYNLGRICSYMLIGAIAGGLGQWLSAHLGHHGSQLLRLMAATIIISLGLYLTGLWRGVAKLEQWGAKLWRHISPLSQYLMPINSRFKTFSLGLLWGFLPCGLVYTVVSWAAASGSVLQGTMIMLFFGLGTLPAMLGTSFLGQGLLQRLQTNNAQVVSGVVVIGFGVWTAFGVSFLHH